MLLLIDPYGTERFITSDEKKSKPVIMFRAPGTSQATLGWPPESFCPFSCQESCGRLTGIGSSEGNQQNVTRDMLVVSVSIPRDWQWFRELFTVTQGYS